MTRHGYGLSPEEIAIAVEWLRINQPDQPVNLETVNKLAASEVVAKTEPAATHAEAGSKGGRGKKAVESLE